MVEFKVIKGKLDYNTIIVRSILSETKVVTSIYHLYIKFSTKNGVGLYGAISMT